MADNKRTIKNIFIFFLCYLPLQYGIVGIVGYYDSEPWPAFVFPGFKNVYVYDQTYQINKFVLEVYGSNGERVREFTAREFFYEIPASQVAGFMRQNLEDPEKITEFSFETRLWLRERAEELGGVPVDEIIYMQKREFLTSGNGVLTRDSISVMKKHPLLKPEAQ